MLDLTYFQAFVKENPELIKELYQQGFLSSGEIRLVEDAVPGIFGQDNG